MAYNQWVTRSTTREVQLGYAMFWGIVAVLIGVAITYVSLPDQLTAADIPTWKMAGWVYLNAHGVGIAGTEVGGLDMAFQTVGFIQSSPTLKLLWVVPLFTTTIAALAVSTSIGVPSRDRRLLENGVAGAIGYTVAGLGLVVVTDARPSIGLVLGLLIALAIAGYLGASIANSLPIPVFAVTSIGGIVAIGIFALLGAATVSAVAVPIGKYAVGGGLVATVILWLGNNLG